jgi:hypothetical protein
MIYALILALALAACAGPAPHPRPTTIIVAAASEPPYGGLSPVVAPLVPVSET